MLPGEQGKLGRFGRVDLADFLGHPAGDESGLAGVHQAEDGEGLHLGDVAQLLTARLLPPGLGDLARQQTVRHKYNVRIKKFLKLSFLFNMHRICCRFGSL